jgi:hypothetical protein
VLRRNGNGDQRGGVAHAVLVSELVEAVFDLAVEHELCGREAVSELLGTAGPDDGRRDGRVCHSPGDRQGHEAHAGLAGQRLQRLDGVELAVVPVTALVQRAGVAEAKTPLGCRALRLCLPTSRPPAMGL